MPQYIDMRDNQVVEAEQFYPEASTMLRVKPLVGARPRDGSWGYLETSGAHVHVGGWIATDKKGNIESYPDYYFKEYFKPYTQADHIEVPHNPVFTDEQIELLQSILTFKLN